MTLRFICAEIERLHLQIRRQQKEVVTLRRSGIGTASAELLLARMQASVVYKAIVWQTARRATLHEPLK